MGNLVSVSDGTAVPNASESLVVGSGFTIRRNFNAGVDGTSAYEKDNPAAIGIGIDSAAADSFFSNEQAYEGSLSVKCKATFGATGFGSWGGRFYFPEQLSEGDTLWYRTRSYYPAGWDFSCGGCTEGMKFMRIHVRKDTDDKNVGYLHTFIKGGTTDGRIIASSEVGGSDFGDNNFDSGNYPRFSLGEEVGRDEWLTVEHQVTFSAGNGVYRLWQNGVLIFEDLVTRTLELSSNTADFVLIYTYWNNGAPKTQSCYIDDIVITSATPSDVDSHGNPYIGMD